MATIIITEEQMQEFEDEQDTSPMLLMTVQNQLNASTSVARFTATARAVQPAEPMHWTERLERDLEGADLVELMELGVR